MVNVRRTRRVAITSFVALGFLAAACGSDSKSSSTTAAAATTAASASSAPATTAATSTSGSATTVATTSGSATTAATTASTPATTAASGGDPLGTPKAATGTPIKVGFVTSGKSTAIDTSVEEPMAKAAVQYINDYLGGVAGHPISLVICETQANGATATACGNQFVQENVLAVLAGSTGEEASVAPPVLAAGIPWMGFNGNSAPTLTDPKAFSQTGAIASIAGGLTQYMLDNGLKHAAVFNINTPGSTSAVNNFLVPLLTKHGLTNDVVVINAGVPDLTPQVSAEMAKNPDIFFIIGNDTFCQSVITAARTLNYDGKIMVIQQCVSAAAADAIPGGYEGVLEQTSLSLDPAAEETKLLDAVLAKYDKDATRGGTALLGYVVTLGFAREVAALTGDVTPASILAAITSAKDVPLPLGGGTKMNCGSKPLEQLPALCSTGTLITVMTKEGGPTTYTPVDPTALFK